MAGQLQASGSPPAPPLPPLRAVPQPPTIHSNSQLHSGGPDTTPLAPHSFPRPSPDSLAAPALTQVALLGPGSFPWPAVPSAQDTSAPRHIAYFCRSWTEAAGQLPPSAGHRECARPPCPLSSKADRAPGGRARPGQELVQFAHVGGRMNCTPFQSHHPSIPACALEDRGCQGSNPGAPCGMQAPPYVLATGPNTMHALLSLFLRAQSLK